jgi:hypothetical protein
VIAAATGFNPLHSTTWSRWDSWRYEQIAAGGYDLHRCPPPRSDRWCGNAGWFPAYPWLVGGLYLLGLPLLGTAVVVSWLFAAATLVVLWNTFFGRRVSLLAVGALLYAAWAPGQIYHYAIFPLSMLAFFTTAYLWLLHRGRHVAAGLAGAAAALAYPLGVPLIFVSAVWLVADRATPLAERLRRIAFASGLPLCAFALFLVDQRLETGRWNAYFLMHKQKLQDPFATTWHALHPLLHGSPYDLVKGPAIQTAIVTAVLAAVIVDVAVRRRRARNRLDGLLLLWAATTWFVTMSISYLTLPRAQAPLLPLAVLVRRLPWPLVFVFLATAFLVSLAIEKLFLHGVLI